MTERRCYSCGAELDLKALKSERQRRAAHVCRQCVERSMTKDQLASLRRADPEEATDGE